MNSNNLNSWSQRLQRLLDQKRVNIDAQDHLISRQRYKKLYYLDNVNQTIAKVTRVMISLCICGYFFNGYY